ncbi:MAG: ribosome assembly cofactor RimP [Bacteroidota bacterium]|nr:ribosome assembly cofactor RimP [Bacteroidota bacterium]
MDKNLIISAITPDVEALGAFLVDVTVSNANDIEIIIEKDADSVTWDDCSALDKAFHEKFNQDEEDYALTVSSAGLDRPFKVMRQFRKAVGTPVDVWMKGGKKQKGILTAVSEEAVVIDETSIPFTAINSVRPYIEMK